jgi:2-polyprenyl-3-methyl-5-hydroxy-6-metoxy-1,4-benzoquinol methylase
MMRDFFINWGRFQKGNAMAAPSCKICRAETRVTHDAQQRLDYFSCPDCEFLFMDEARRLSPDKERKHYEKHNNSPQNEGYVRMFQDFIDRAVTPHHPRIGTALDFGCGPGPVLAGLLEERGFDVDVYDPFFAPNENYLRRTFDLITATEVFEHLSDPMETLEHLADHLNPGGILALMTLFHPDDEEVFESWWYRRDPTHVSFYRPKTLAVMAEQTRLKCVYQDEKRICVLKKETGNHV